MQNLRRIYRYTGLGAIAASLMLTSCINDDSLCPADDGGEEQITLEFTVVTRDLEGNGTRALVVPTNTQDGTMAENYLDLDHTTFLLFDETKTLIKVFVPYVDPVENTGYAKYSVRAFMSPQEFHTLTDGKTNVTFSIAVVGNYSRLTPQNAAYHIGQKLDDIFTSTAGIAYTTFAMPVSNNQGNVWIPSIYGTPYTDAAGHAIDGMTPAHIPMAGIQTYTVAVSDLQNSTVSDPLTLPEDINMLRAIAKIEVVDRIDAVGEGVATVQPSRDNRTWIEKVELVGHTTRGALFPTLAQWNISGSPYETQYVTATSIPNTSTYVGAEMTEAVNEANLINFFADAVATAAREDGCRVFTCYLTEYNPANVAQLERMWLRVTAQLPGSTPTEERSTFYNLRVGNYVNGTVDTSMPILRNNIYRYEVTGLQGDLNLTLVVDDWNAAPVEWEYTDNPGVTDPIEWTSGEVNRNLATVMCPYGQEISATFTIATPVDGEWTAQVLPLNANTASDAFVFVNEAGKEVETISGTVNGAPSTIRLRAKYEAFEYNREAMLVITVKNPVDNRIITADVLNGEYGRNTYFTIIQNASL